jgi:hypothetical protein
MLPRLSHYTSPPLQLERSHSTGGVILPTCAMTAVQRFKRTFALRESDFHRLSKKRGKYFIPASQKKTSLLLELLTFPKSYAD